MRKRKRERLTFSTVYFLLTITLVIGVGILASQSYTMI